MGGGKGATGAWASGVNAAVGGWELWWYKLVRSSRGTFGSMGSCRRSRVRVVARVARRTGRIRRCQS